MNQDKSSSGGLFAGLVTILSMVFMFFKSKKVIPSGITSTLKKRSSKKPSQNQAKKGAHPPLEDGYYFDDTGICRDRLGRPLRIDPDNKNNWFLDYELMQKERQAGKEYNYPDLKNAQLSQGRQTIIKRLQKTR